MRKLEYIARAIEQARQTNADAVLIELRTPGGLVDQTGSKCYDADYFPWGAEQHVYTNSCPQDYKFTGKERDPDLGIDYFGARFYKSDMARFYSPDPVGGVLSNPQSLNRYVYVLNNPLRFIDPTGMIVEWKDSEAHCAKGETVCRTKAQREYEDRLAELIRSNDPKARARGELLSNVYGRLQASKAVFEVVNKGGSGENGGEITYQGHDHFTINLHGADNYGLTDNQRLAHEFEHGRQVLDKELSFISTPTGWKPFFYDRTDEAKAFAAGFEIDRAAPGQGTFANSLQQNLDEGGISGGVQFLGSGKSAYRNLPEGPIDVEYSTPSIYRVPD